MARKRGYDSIARTSNYRNLSDLRNQNELISGNPLVATSTEEEITYRYFQYDGATVHTSRQNMDPIYTIFIPDRVVSRDQSGLGRCWSPRSPDVLVWDYIWCGTLKPKVYHNNLLCLLDKIIKNILS
ncbi:hypothetical protein TNCV_3885611 [Trichonephila clavipes]|nr:hypothetical protein TNCV_3885611 [Trichonephila clavipes]